MQSLQLLPGKKVFFASDFHLGIPDAASSLIREKRLCAWLDQIQPEAQALFLMGDLFDSWIEYKRVVPAGFVRFLGKLATLSDAGVQLFIFTGNHDLWMQGYFERELNAQVFKTLQEFRIQGKLFHLAHGDGLHHSEGGYRWMKKLFHHSFSQWLYRKLHPDWGLGLADYFSRRGLKHRTHELEQMKEESKEFQLLYAREVIEKQAVDYFIFGHRHIPLQKKLAEGTEFINLGDWIRYNTYGVFDGREMQLLQFPKGKPYL